MHFTIHKKAIWPIVFTTNICSRHIIAIPFDVVLHQKRFHNLDSFIFISSQVEHLRESHFFCFRHRLHSCVKRGLPNINGDYHHRVLLLQLAFLILIGIMSLHRMGNLNFQLLLGNLFFFIFLIEGELIYLRQIKVSSIILLQLSLA